MNTTYLIIAFVAALAIVVGIRYKTKGSLKKAEPQHGVDLVLMRGRNVGDVLTGVQFNDGHYNYEPATGKPAKIPLISEFCRKTPRGLMMFWDLDRKVPVAYEGDTMNEDDVLVLRKDKTLTDEKGNAEEISKGSDVQVVWKQFWHQINGSTLYALDRNTDWMHIEEGTQDRWAWLQRYVPHILIMVLFITIIGAVGVFLQ